MGEIMQGHVLDILRGMEAESIDCIITSPPYWGLRDYKGEPQVWDDPGGCEHKWDSLGKSPQRIRHGMTVGSSVTLTKAATWNPSHGEACSHCGAWRGALGLEPTYQLYLQHLMQVMTELKRVLKKTGTLWVNIGDCYAGSNRGYGTINLSAKQLSNKGSLAFIENPPLRAQDIPSKSLVGIPERFVIAMTDAGWIRRNTIIWWKPNCMPQSAKDRFTADFEYLYFFTKGAKYWFNQLFEPLSESTLTDYRNETGRHTSGRNTKYIESDESDKPSWYRSKVFVNSMCGRNMRAVWRIPTQPFSEAHFATFPEALVERCIRAGCPKGGVVLDPFMGSGTVAVVAERLNRQWAGIELNAQYIAMALCRLKSVQKELI